MSTQKVFASYGLELHGLTIPPETLSQLGTQGYFSFLTTLTVNGQKKIVEINGFCLKAEKFFNAAASIKKDLYKRPSSKLRKSLRPKGKK